jgi:hypothetical protein
MWSANLSNVCAKKLLHKVMTIRGIVSLRSVTLLCDIIKYYYVRLNNIAIP